MDGGGASRTSEETDENDEDEDEDEDVEMTTYRATYDISKRSAREGGLSGEEEDGEEENSFILGRKMPTRSGSRRK